MSDVKDYSQLKERLDQIVEAVSDEGISLDDALALYEEAVKLGSAASALIEQDISAKTAEELAAALAAEQAEAEGAESASDAAGAEQETESVHEA